MQAEETKMEVITVYNSPPKRPACSQISPVAKRVKLSPEEKLQKQAIKEAERAAKEHERLAREAEKAAREAERATKEAEKEVKRLEREEQRRAKEDAKAKEKQMKEEAKAKELAAQEKKEKAQLRMGNFFKKADPKPPAVLCKEESVVFKPFYLKEHVRLAPRREHSNQNDEAFASMIDANEGAAMTTRERFLNTRKTRNGGRRKRVPRRTLRETLAQVSNLPLSERLRDVNYKLLQFHSDVRPPYFGTCTTTPTDRGLERGRRPYAKTSELNYDYDSEADWIQGDEEDAGEEIGDDDDMSVASRDTYGDDSDDFLDDGEQATFTERSRQGGCLLPSILGIFTPDDCGPVEHMKLQKLLDIQGPIDPFQDYWETKSHKSTISSTSKELQGILTATTVDNIKQPSLTRKPSGTSAFPDQYLPEFKKAIQGSNLTKILLVEKLRIEFKAHKVSKKAIEDKLAEVAHRLGKGQHDVWALNA